MGQVVVKQNFDIMNVSVSGSVMSIEMILSSSSCENTGRCKKNSELILCFQVLKIQNIG